jgi:hypothetical protein
MEVVIVFTTAPRRRILRNSNCLLVGAVRVNTMHEVEEALDGDFLLDFMVYTRSFGALHMGTSKKKDMRFPVTESSMNAVYDRSFLPCS